MSEFSGKSSSQITRELEEKRQRLRGELGGLNQQFQPNQLWEAARATLSNSGSGEFARNLGRSVRDNPLPVALVGAGIAWMIVGQGGNARGNEPVEASNGRHHPATIDPLGGPVTHDVGMQQSTELKYEGDADTERSDGNVADDARRNIDAVRNRVGESRKRVGQSLESAKDATQERLSSAQARSQQVVTRSADRIQASYQDNPIVFGLGAAALAAVAGMLLPGTRREDEVLGSYSDQARREARKAANTGLERASDIVRKTAETTRDEAHKRGYDGDKAEALLSKAIDDTRDIAGEAAKTASKESRSSADSDSTTNHGLDGCNSGRKST